MIKGESEKSYLLNIFKHFVNITYLQPSKRVMRRPLMNSQRFLENSRENPPTL